MYKRIGVVATALAASFPGIDLTRSSLSPSAAVAKDHDTETYTVQNQRSGAQAAAPQNDFQSASKALPMYEGIEKDLRAGRPVANERVIELFRRLEEEPSTRVSFAPAYYERFADPNVRTAILNYFDQSSYLMSAMGRLREALKSPSVELQAAALRNVAKRADAVLEARSKKILKDTGGTIRIGEKKGTLSVEGFDPDNVFKDRSLPVSFLRSPSRDVRVAAIRVAQLFGVKIEKLDLLDALRASESLGEHALEAGCEVRLGGRFVDGLLASGAWKDGDESLAQISMPLLHLMQRIDTQYPGLLDSLREKETLATFAAGIGKHLLTERARIADTVLIDDTSNVLAALHSEEMSSHFPVVQLCEELGIQDSTIIKAKKVGSSRSERETFERKYADELNNAVSQEHRQRYLAKLDSLEVDDFKGEYLKAINQLVDDPNARAMIWNLGHGETRHFWFRQGLPGTMSRTDLHHPDGVSYSEIAHALFYEDPETRVVKSGGRLDLSSKVLVLSPCLQYDMALAIIGELQRLADQHSVELVMPNIIASSQRGMVSYAANPRIVEVPEIEDPNNPTGPKILSAETYLLAQVSSPVFMDSLVANSQDKRIKVEDVLREDFNESRVLEDLLRDPQVLEPYSEIGEHDPAFFFSRGLSVERIVRETLDEIGEPETSLPKASVPPAKGASDLFYELGMGLPPLPRLLDDKRV